MRARDVRVASWEEVLRRARARDAEAMGGAEVTELRYRRRYLPGQAIYFSEMEPQRRARFTIENSDVAAPRLDRTAVSEGVDEWVRRWLPGRAAVAS